MSDEGFAALKAMVTVARERVHACLAEVRTELVRCGHSDAAIDEAVKTWAAYEARKDGANHEDHR